MTVSEKSSFRSSGDIYKLDREIIKQEALLRDLRREMFVKLVGFIDIDHPERTDTRMLGRLFNVCRVLSEEDDVRAKYWMAMFYGGKFGSAIIGPEYRKALWYINSINNRIPVYDLAVDICDYFGKKNVALSYALQGVVSLDISIKDRLKLARYFADNHIIPDLNLSFPKGIGKDFVKAFLDYLSKNYADFGLKSVNMDICAKGFATMI